MEDGDSLSINTPSTMEKAGLPLIETIKIAGEADSSSV